MTPNQRTVLVYMPAALQELSWLDHPITDLLQEVNGMEEPEIVTYNIRLAVQELCTNIVSHAYAGQEGSITLKFTLYSDPAQVVITASDKATNTFDRGSWQAPNLDDPQVHGLGLWLIEELMDEVSYQPCAGDNRWRLVKRLPVREKV